MPDSPTTSMSPTTAEAGDSPSSSPTPSARPSAASHASRRLSRSANRLTPSQQATCARLLAEKGDRPGAIALLRPLVDGGLLPADYPVTINAVSGYSGGGKSMIASFEDGSAPAFHLYGLGFEHKHVPEMQLYSHLTRRPLLRRRRAVLI